MTGKQSQLSSNQFRRKASLKEESKLLTEWSDEKGMNVIKPGVPGSKERSQADGWWPYIDVAKSVMKRRSFMERMREFDTETNGYFELDQVVDILEIFLKEQRQKKRKNKLRVLKAVSITVLVVAVYTAFIAFNKIINT